MGRYCGAGGVAGHKEVPEKPAGTVEGLCWLPVLEYSSNSLG